MARKLKLIFGLTVLAVFGMGIVLGIQTQTARAEEVPDYLAANRVPAGDSHRWESLEFEQPIPHNWGTVFSINRVEKGGESYTFWFLAADGTLRGVTTREFTGPNRASFFPEVYVIRRK